MSFDIHVLPDPQFRDENFRDCNPSMTNTAN
jgi:hypothetical protein